MATTVTIFAAVAQERGQDAGVICYAASASEAISIAARSFAPFHVTALVVPEADAKALTATVPPTRLYES